MLMLLSWRQGYTLCDLTCAPITAMYFVSSQTETVDLFSLERCFVQRVTCWSWLPYFPSYRIDILLCLGHCINSRFMLIGGGSACACTRVGSLATVCTMSIEQHAWAYRCINIIFDERWSFLLSIVLLPLFWLFRFYSSSKLLRDK